MDKNILKPDDTINRLIHSLKIGMFQCEPTMEGKITFINISGAEILGYNTPEDVLGIPLCNHFSNSTDYSYWLKQLEDSRTQTDYDIQCKRKDGKVHAIAITGSLVLDAEGNKVRIDGTIQDIHLNKKEELEKEIVSNINKIMVSNLNMKEVDHLICDELYKIIEWDRVSITLLENKGDVVINFVLTRGKGEKGTLSKTMPEKSHYPLIGSILEKVVGSGKPFIVKDTSLGLTDTDKVYANEGIKSRLAYPLEYKNKIIGSINFGCSKASYYDTEHIKLLEKIGPSLAFGIENAKLYERASKAEKEYKDLSQTFDSPWG